MNGIGRRALLRGAVASGLCCAPPLRFARAAGQRQVVVIGAGIAGLSAAWDLQQAGFRVTVLEKNAHPGGRMAETMRGPLWFPTGASGIFEANREMYLLAAALGVAAELYTAIEYPEYNRTSVHGSYLAHLRWHSTEIMNVPGMSAATRAAIPSVLPDLADIRARVDPCLLGTGADWDGESVQEYFTRRLGQSAATELIEYWVQPGLDPWAWYAEETSMIAWLSVVAQQDARWVIPASGVGFLTRALAQRLDLRLNTTVHRVSAPDAQGRRTVHYLGRGPALESVTPDVVVVAVEGNWVLPLVEGLAREQQEFFRGIHMSEWAALAYVLDPRHAPDSDHDENYTDGHPNRRRWKLSGWGYSPGDPARAGAPPLVWVGLDRAGIEEWRAAGGNLADFCLPRLKAVYPAFDPDEVTDSVFLGKDDMLLYMPSGFVRGMADFLRQQAQSRAGLYFTGEYLGHAHTGGACAAGREVAKLVVRHWS
jgi:oxygen-dependent protoporphyrinogen oxidase